MIKALSACFRCSGLVDVVQGLALATLFFSLMSRQVILGVGRLLPIII